jgi:hypothetical protein
MSTVGKRTKPAVTPKSHIVGGPGQGVYLTPTAKGPGKPAAPASTPNPKGSIKITPLSGTPQAIPKPIKSDSGQ